MPEQEQIHDMSVEVGKESKPDLELLQGEELDKIVGAVNDLAGKLERDERVIREDVLKLDEALGQVRIDFYGEKMTVADIREIPDLERNLEIFKTIVEDDRNGALVIDSKIHKITYMPAEIARLLVKWSFDRGPKDRGLIRNLYANHVKELSDSAVQELSHFDGWIHLNHLLTLTDAQADFLASHQGGAISMDSLENISENGLQSLARHSKSIRLPIDLEKRLVELGGKGW